MLVILYHRVRLCYFVFDDGVWKVCLWKNYYCRRRIVGGVYSTKKKKEKKRKKIFSSRFIDRSADYALDVNM